MDMIFLNEQLENFQKPVKEGSIYSIIGINNNFKLSDSPVSISFNELTAFKRYTVAGTAKLLLGT
ncbi:hypothetical protein Bca4012_063069 [Brassica carinata]